MNHNSYMAKSTYIRWISWALVALWGYAGAAKLFGHEAFRFQLLGHPLLKGHAGLVAWGVPLAELLLLPLLLWRRTLRAGLWGSLLLLLLFTGYIVYMFMYYPQQPCSCGGIISALGWRQHIVFNLSFALLAAAGLVYGWGGKSAARGHPTSG